MADSATSSDVNINIYDNKGKVNQVNSNSDRNKSHTAADQKKSSDTDYYMNLLANDEKVVLDKQSVSSESEILNSDSSSSRETSSIKSGKSSKSDKNKSSPRKTIPVINKTNNKRYDSPTAPETKITVELTPQEIRMKKIELLRKLSEIKTKGFSLTKEYDFSSSIEEMEYEYELLKSFVDKRNGIKIYKNILLNGVSVVEFLNDKYDPFDFHLQGWGEHMSVEVDSYDDVLEELYEKYKGTGKKMPPELKLVLLLVASGSAFHFTKTQSSIPGLEAALHKNPDLVSRLINSKPEQSQFMSQQELNIQKQRAILQQRDKEMKQKQQAASQMPSFLKPPTMPAPQRTVAESNEPVASNQSSNKIPEIRAPSNVQDILNRIKQSQGNKAGHTTETQEESSSNNDRILSDANLTDSKKGRKAKAPPAISISTM